MASQYDSENNGVFFSLFSASAKNVELCLFEQPDNNPLVYPMTVREGNVWSVFVSNITPGAYYGFRVDMRPHILLDPYAEKIEFNQLQILSVVTEDHYDWQGDHQPNIPWENTIIYEAHVKGLTQLHADLPEDIRGTYAALAHPIIIQYLSQLGITTLELMPIQQHINEPRLQNLGLNNYWGYNVIAPFALEPDYWSKRRNTTANSEFKDAVKALHQAGIEVILDVVFNHTAELDEMGPIYSLKGIDKPHYYWLNQQGELENWTGCGNTLKLTEPEVIQWVMDCLRYWVNEFHIDGFRFDLGTVLGRTPEFSNKSPLFIAILQDPLLRKIKLISEPWDIGTNGYQLGNFLYPFAEWNDQYRDDMRRFWLQGDISLGQFAQRFAASSQIFNRNGRKPSASVNFITCHDGFTLCDLVSFDHKHNDANGECNRDGSDHNWSHNFGVEGIDNIPKEIIQKRQLAQQALLSILLLSQGTPMLLAGDEWGNSQQGNNNSYCQDNAIGWLNWADKNIELLHYTQQLILLRKQILSLNNNQWWYTDINVRWLNHHGEPLSNIEWQDRQNLSLHIELDKKWLILINANEFPCEFYITKNNYQKKLGDISPVPNKTGYWLTQAKTISILTYID